MNCRADKMTSSFYASLKWWVLNDFIVYNNGEKNAPVFPPMTDENHSSLTGSTLELWQKYRRPLYFGTDFSYFCCAQNGSVFRTNKILTIFIEGYLCDSEKSIKECY